MLFVEQVESIEDLDKRHLVLGSVSRGKCGPEQRLTMRSLVSGDRIDPQCR